MTYLSNTSNQNPVTSFPVPENHLSSGEISVTGENAMNTLEPIAKNEMTQQLTPQSSKVKSFLKWAGLDILNTTVSTIGNGALASANICLYHYMPDSLANMINNTNMHHTLIRNILAPNSTFLKIGVIGPITEELQYRLVIQELLLKQLPKKILGKISPTHVDLVDSKAAKYARVLISSLMFGMVHYVPPGMIAPEGAGSCILSNRVINAFGMGLIFGTLQETTGNVAYPMLAHMLHNFIPAVAAEAIGMQI